MGTIKKWVNIVTPSGAEDLNNIPEEYLAFTDYGVHICWPNAGKTIIPWHFIKRIDYNVEVLS